MRLYAHLEAINVDQLTNEQIGFFIGLVYLMHRVGVGYLCKESADEIVRRYNAMSITTWPLTVELLEPFYGFRTNTKTITSYQWALHNMGTLGAFNPRLKKLQPLGLEMQILNALEQVEDSRLRRGKAYGLFRLKLRRLIADYNRGISKLPEYDDGCGPEWVRNIRRLAAAQKNQAAHMVDPTPTTRSNPQSVMRFAGVSTRERKEQLPTRK